jgi:hypothetical protein
MRQPLRAGARKFARFFHQIDQNLAIPNTSNVSFPKPDQYVMSFSWATRYALTTREIAAQMLLERGMGRRLLPG